MKTQVHTQFPAYAFPRVKSSATAPLRTPRRPEGSSDKPAQASAPLRVVEGPAILGYN